MNLSEYVIRVEATVTTDDEADAMLDALEAAGIPARIEAIAKLIRETLPAAVVTVDQ